jgi:catechol 2,3-dioxygenase-like lactoylglutathione lyase family enzyme
MEVAVLSDRRVYATIPASDLARAQGWYAEKLGLRPRTVEEMGAVYDLGDGTGFLLYPTPNAGKAPNTLMTFASSNVGADVEALRGRGVQFEEYDFPGLRTVNGVAKIGDREAAWFKDSEGNILALGSSPD